MVTQISLGSKTKQIWQTLYEKSSPPSPFFSYQWHTLWFKLLANEWQPFILIINNQLIAPFAKRGAVVIFSGGEEVADYADLVGPDVEKSRAWPEILLYLKQNSVTQLQLKNIPQTSPTIAFFRDRATIRQVDTTPLMKLPLSWDTYLNILSHKRRHELRRKLRKFEREHPSAHVFVCSNPKADCEEFFRLMRLNPEKRAFLRPEMEVFFREFLITLKDQVLLLHLKVYEAVVASTLSFITPTAVLLYNSGFDQDQASGSGFYLKARGIQMAIEQGFKEYNFLQGSERYKYELGGKDFRVYSINFKIES